MTTPRVAVASFLLLLALLVLLAPPVSGSEAPLKVIAWLTVAPEAVLPGETAEIEFAFDVSGGEGPPTREIKASGLDGLAIVAESSSPECTRDGWTWTCSPDSPGRQTLDLTVLVPVDEPWANARVFVFALAHPGGARWAVAEDLWILGTRVHMSSEAADVGNGTSMQSLLLNVTGPGAATEVWLSAVPALGASLVSSSPEPTSFATDRAIWFRENLTQGRHRFDLLLACPSGTCAAAATLQYADASGHVLPPQHLSVMGEASTGAVGPPDPNGLVPLALVGSAFAILGVLFAARSLGYEVLPTAERCRSPREVYVISKSGTLLAHRRRNGVSRQRDEDILAGMFTAVREFARDAMRSGPTGLVVLCVGEERVTFVEGRHTVVAFVGAGRIRRAIVARATAELERLESAHGVEIERWNGSSPELAVASESIADLLLS